MRSAIVRMIPIWKKLGHSIVKNYKSANVQLSIIKIKTKNDLPKVLRLDGVYYDKDDNYIKRNAEIGTSHKIADAVIYQSNLSKLMCEKYLIPRKTEIVDVIYNGIESWNNPLTHGDINIMACAKWRRHKRLPEIVDIFKKFQKFVEDSKLHIIGPMVKGCSKIEHRDIIYYDKIDENKMKEIYRIGDIFLHLSKKDSCPSTVVESISAGIPVIATNFCGGATEMCKLTDNCFIVNGDSESLEPDYIYRNNYNKISDKMQLDVVEIMIKIYKNKLRTNLPKELTIEYTAKKYIDIMRKVI